VLLKKRRVTVSPRVLMIGLGAVVAASVANNALQIRRTHVVEHNFNIAEGNRELESILGPNAVVSGPYGPVLTVDGHLRSIIHIIGVADLDSSMFDRFPITHLAVDVSNWTRVAQEFPKIADLHPMATYWIRDNTVNLYRIADVYNNPEARRYRPSVYERAADLFHEGQIDSALAELEPFQRAHPYCKAAGLLLAELYNAKAQYDHTRKVLIQLANAFPTDFNIQLQAGRFLQMLSYDLNDQRLLSMAIQYYERAVKVNRFKGLEVNNLYDGIERQYRSRGSRP